jgi:iron-sulfur cluster assembly accessory protein
LKPRRPTLILAKKEFDEADLKGRSMETVAAHEVSVSMSESAARRLVKILAKEEAGAALRVSVKGGGCSGFQYSFDIEKSPAADDLVVERDGATMLIDPVSLEYMAGAELDFVDDLMGQSFRVKNPNAVASCGCGVSFSV